MAFLVKLGLFTVYLAMLIIVLRTLDWASWRGQPEELMSMPGARLKAILEQRGVEYSHLYEKAEFARKIKATGPISNEELAILQRNTSEGSSIENFTNYLSFCEQVYDKRDNIWLIEIIVQQKMISERVWNELRKKLSKFGVKFGRLNCVNYTRFCKEKGWTSSRLVLATPSHNEKEATFCNPITYTYPYTVEPNAIFKWLKQEVNQGLTVVRDKNELTQNWLEFPDVFISEVRVLYVSKDQSVPFCLSSLAFKYAGRVKMGIVNADSDTGKYMFDTYQMTAIPSYLIITRQMTYNYGQHKGDQITYEGFDFVLTTVYPTLNDVLKISMICINMIVCFEVCFVKGRILKVSLQLVYVICKYNVFHLFACMITWLLLKINFMKTLIQFIVLPMRTIILSQTVSILRYDLFYCSNNLAIPSSVLVGIITFICVANHFKTRPLSPTNAGLLDDTNSEVNGNESQRQESNGRRVSVTGEGVERSNNLEHHVSEEDNERQRLTHLYANMLLRHSGSLRLEFNGEHIRIELVSHDYIQFLPVWKHSKDVTCKGYCRMKDTDENISHIRKSTVVNTSGIPCTISGVSSVKNINVMRHAPDGFTFDSSCVICLEDFEQLEILRGLPCKHTFHDACVINWLLSETSNRLCPSCRFPAHDYSGINADLHMDIDDFCQMFD